MNRPEAVPAATLNGLPRQRVAAVAGRSEKPGDGEPVARGPRAWAARIWRRYAAMSVAADPLLSTVWIQGQCIDVSIYDRDWPESYLY